MNSKILVIEDDPSALRFIEYTLQQEGYQVLSAKNGLEGLRKARKEEPDLIVLDIMLPGIDGFEICHRLRAEPETAQLPILMLSAKAQEIDKATGLKMGADDYLTKPADPSEIVSRVETLLAQRTASRSKMIAFLGLKGAVGTTTIVVNTAVALAQRDKRVIVVDLCPYGGKVMEHLGLKPERTITELLEKSMDAVSRRDLESALAVHDSGVRALAIAQPSGGREDISPSDIALLFDRLREVSDYLLVDLLFQSSDSGKAALTKCDLVIIVSDFKAGTLSDVKSIAALLDKLGITPERISTVVIDRDAIFPEAEISKMKGFVEERSGVSLLGIIPYDTNASLEPVPGTPVILFNPNSPMAWSVRGVAQHIIGEKINNKDSS